MSPRNHPYVCCKSSPVKFYVRLLRRGENTFHAFCTVCLPTGGHRLVEGSNWREITWGEWRAKRLQPAQNPLESDFASDADPYDFLTNEEKDAQIREWAASHSRPVPAPNPLKEMPARRIRFLASRWAEKQPGLAARLEKAVALTGGVSSQGEGVYVVEGSSGHEYIVHADPETKVSTCNCPDSELGNHCKHRLATALVYLAELDLPPHPGGIR